MLTIRFGFPPLKTDDGLPSSETSAISPPGTSNDSRDGRDAGAWDSTAFEETGLRERLDGFLGRIDVGNGTPIAAAVADALGIDLRLHGSTDSAQRLCEVSDEELLDIALRLAGVFDGDGGRFDLPFGSRVERHGPGSVRIDDEVWTLNFDAPGLHSG